MKQIVVNRDDLNLKVLSGITPVNVGGATSATIQLINPDGVTWSSAVLTVRRSLDGKNPVARVPAVTISAVGMTEVDVADDMWLHVDVTTAESASGDVTIIVMVSDVVVVSSS